jgi:hypothetical protein
MENNQKAPYFSEKKFILNYDDEGLLHGTHYIDRFHTMYFEHGECNGVLTYDGQTGYNEFDDNDNFIGAKGYAIDSVFRDQKIWKRNFQLIKNCGFIEAYTLPNLYNVNEIRLLSLAAIDYRNGMVDATKIFDGSTNKAWNKMKLFNSEASSFHQQYESNYINFCFEFRYSQFKFPGIYVNTESNLLNVMTGDLTNLLDIDTLDFEIVLFGLENLHCWLGDYGKEILTDNRFYLQLMFNWDKPTYNDNLELLFCQRLSYHKNDYHSPSKIPRFGKEETLQPNFDNNIEQTGFSTLENLYSFINNKPNASRLSVNVYFLNKELKKTIDKKEEEVLSLVLYPFDDIIDMKAIRAKKREIEEKFEKEQNEIKSKINSTVSSINIELKNEQWESLLPLSKSLDSLIKISNKNNYQITFSDPREEFLKGKDMDFISYLKNQIKLKKIESDYTSLKIGLEELAEKYKFEFTTNIKVSGNTTDLFERLSIKELTVDDYLKNLENSLFKLNRVIEGNFSITDKISLNAFFSDKEGAKSPLYFELSVPVDKPKKDFIVDKKLLQQEWKLNSPDLIFQFSTKDSNPVVCRFGSILKVFNLN